MIFCFPIYFLLGFGVFICLLFVLVLLLCFSRVQGSGLGSHGCLGDLILSWWDVCLLYFISSYMLWDVVGGTEGIEEGDLLYSQCMLCWYDMCLLQYVL